jgi:hypothetical protein
MPQHYSTGHPRRGSQEIQYGTMKTWKRLQHAIYDRHGLNSRSACKLLLIGQSIDVSAADYAGDELTTAFLRASHLLHNAYFRLVSAVADIKSERLRRGSVTSAGSQRDDRRTTVSGISLSLSQPVALTSGTLQGPESPTPVPYITSKAAAPETRTDGDVFVLHVSLL